MNTRLMAKTFFALLALLCSCAGPDRSPIGPTFAPSDEARAYTEAMAQRFARATGRTDITASSDGDVPVEFADDVYTLIDGAMKRVCGATTWRRIGDEFVSASILIDRSPDACPPVHVTLLHEAIHAMNPEAEHCTAQGHLFSVFGGGSKIDEPSLVELCAGFECLEFNPE